MNILTIHLVAPQLGHSILNLLFIIQFGIKLKSLVLMIQYIKIINKIKINSFIINFLYFSFIYFTVFIIQQIKIKIIIYIIFTYYLKGDFMNFNIKRKRIYFISFFVCFSILIYVIMYNIGLKNEYIETNATPITNKTIVIDAGHGLPDSGASSFNGTTEQAINLSIALKLQKIIEQSGAKVILTRSDENGIYSTDSSNIRNKKVSDIKNRVEIGNNSEADIFVSIHLNKFSGSSEYKGWQTFYQKENENSILLATKIQENLNKNIEQDNNRKVMPLTNVYIMDNIKIPTVIVECGFLSNPEETENLKKDEYQNKLVWGIYLGIQDYFYNEVNESE